MATMLWGFLPIFNKKGNPLLRKGFTLVELMVTVAIIGILATLAVPVFQSFQVRARQAEAKTYLSAAYLSEVSFQVNSGFYSGCLGAIGYEVIGDRHYLIGFSFGFEGAVTAPTNAKMGVCDPSAGEVINETYFPATKFIPSLAKVNPVDVYAVPADSGVSAREFLVYAVGTPGIRDADDYDYWSIDHRKRLVQSDSNGTLNLGGASWSSAFPSGW